MKKFFLFVTVVTLFAACSSDNAADNPVVKTAAAGQEIGFSAYVNRGTTRAGFYGDIDASTTLQGANANFGVFAYYTDNNDYDQFSIPNFMYNQKVTYSPTQWTYSPVRYWPNEHGSTAESEDVDRVTFFAYAPYVSVDYTTGKVNSSAVNYADETGIVGMSRNSSAGDPLVKYVVSLDPAKKVDLLWGVIGSGEATGATNEWTLKETSDGQLGMTAGFPWLNIQRPDGVTQQLKFTFDHALAKLNVQIDAFVDGTDATNAVAANNKIFIRSITFTGFATKGALNLNNTDAGANTAKWLSFNCTSDLEIGEEVTIYDGRKDGKEGVSASSAEKVTGLNPVLVESAVWASTEAGVTKTAVNLFKPDASLIANPANPQAAEIAAQLADPIYVIPTGEEVNVTIVYEVEAVDANLPTFLADGATHGSRVLSTITQKAVIAKLENGKAYTLKLHLGMNSVKFDADVTGWNSSADPNADSNLPAN